MTDRTMELVGDRLRVVFNREQDRLTHRIESRLSPTAPWQAQAWSVEGTNADRWPLCPPLQQLHFENRPDGRALAMAVGVAGTAHWSVVFALHANELTVEAACRTSRPPTWLGSTYQLSPDHFDRDRWFALNGTVLATEQLVDKLQVKLQPDIEWGCTCGTICWGFRLQS